LEDDIYLRYLSFSTAEELQAEMVRRVPHKIDIGAVFNAKPSDHKKIANFQVPNITLRDNDIFLGSVCFDFPSSNVVLLSLLFKVIM
jgi:hypothetical protein